MWIAMFIQISYQFCFTGSNSLVRDNYVEDETKTETKPSPNRPHAESFVWTLTQSKMLQNKVECE